MKFLGFAVCLGGVLAVGTVVRAQETPATQTRIGLVGDSTMQDYALESPKRGWGQIFPELVDSTRVLVKNFAAGGRSTKTFKAEGRWDKVLEFKPNYVFIQFGHNDSHAREKPEATDAKTEFPANLRGYIDSARAQGIIPFLGDTDAPGHLEENTPTPTLTEELLPYAEATRQVAVEKNVPLIDLYSLSGKAFEELGRDQLPTLFPGTDRSHFNAKGARLLAEFVQREAIRLAPAYGQATASATAAATAITTQPK